MGLVDNICDDLLEILHEDDVQKLHKFMEDYPGWYYAPLLDICLELKARDCVLYVIQGNLPHGPPSLAFAHTRTDSGYPTLYLVILYMCDPLVFDLLFTHCNAATQANRPYARLLPLHWLLYHLRHTPPLSDWSLSQPVSNLIYSLLEPQVRPMLECARTLAQHTHSLDQVALGYILNGEIIPLAALLLVASFTPGELNTMKSYTRLKDVASQAIHGHQSITNATCCAAALLDVFKKEGDKLTSMFNNPQKESAQGDQSILNRPWLIDIRYMGRVFTESTTLISSAWMDEFIGRDRQYLEEDAKSSFGHYILFLRSLTKEMISHSLFGWPALISLISNFIESASNVPDLQGVCLLHVVLYSLGKYEYLSKWSPGESLVKLMLLLFLQPKLNPTLECAQLLAKRGYLVDELAWNLVGLGKPIQLVGLLLVAPKKAVLPFPLRNTIMETVVSMVWRGESVAAIAGAAGLCEIFLRAGKKLARYYWSTHNDEHGPDPVQVIVDIATIIQRSGFQVLSADVDLTDMYITSSHTEMLKSICKRLGIEIGDETSALSQTSRKSPFPSAESVRRGSLKFPISLPELTQSSERIGLFELLGDEVWKS